MFEQSFKNIDDILHKDAGCGSELDYVEQTSWVLFLKYLDDLEKDKENAALLSGEEYTRLIEPTYQWTTWAAPKLADGKIDHNAQTGDDLLDFVNNELFPYLKKFKANASGADTIEYKIGEIFSELKNRIQSGYNLREVVALVDELRFRTHAEQLEMSHLYEGKIKNMGNAGRNGGEYYTPRPLIKTIVKVVDPKIGETVYDGAVGSAGFLVEAFDYMRNIKKLSTQDIETLQKKTFYGKEKKSLAYIIGIMNMILHGVEAPNIVHTNTLAENIADIQEKDRYNVVLANPPFGGKERAEVQENFPIKTGETASLFLQHFIKILKAGGKGAVIIKNTFLSNGGSGSADASIRKELLENCNLHTVLDLPGGTFTGAGVKTVVLFFTKGEPTKKVWFYKLNLDRNLGKTNPLNEKDLADFVALQKTKAESENSWTVRLSDVDQTNFDLSVNNPNTPEEAPLRQPNEIFGTMEALDKKSSNVMSDLKLLIGNVFENKGDDWEIKKLKDCCEVFADGDWIERKDQSSEGIRLVQTGNIGFGYFKDKKDKSRYISEETFNRLNCTEILPGDLLVSRLPDPVGKSCIIPEINSKMITGVDCTIIRPKDILSSEFLRYYQMSDQYLKDVQSKVSGATRQRISRKNLGLIEIPIPPLSKQQQLVKKLDTLSAEINKIESMHAQKIADLEEMKKSVLQKAFSV